ncbi:hypothetical protein B6J67_13335 [Klebsiella quasipneumoniae]|nr:hypothetical protein B6J67_13335 [Klebsiella quasipneumoniae]PLJ62486.1 hypothetical protein B6J68_12355 [Klebsiella quasipneumoniae]
MATLLIQHCALSKGAGLLLIFLLNLMEGWLSQQIDLMQSISERKMSGRTCRMVITSGEG